MKSPTFDCARSTNYQLHNKICQQDQYSSYLNRVKLIVDKKPSFDDSPSKYMNFLHKTKVVAKDHQVSEDNIKIQLDNKHLLDKIVKNKSRKVDFSMQTYHLAMHEKRHRQIERINRENKKISKRIGDQHSVVRKNILTQNNSFIREEKTEKRNITAQGWNCSPLKLRKLPKLTQFYGEAKEN